MVSLVYSYTPDKGNYRMDCCAKSLRLDLSITSIFLDYYFYFRLWHTACLGRDSDVVVFGGSRDYILLVDTVGIISKQFLMVRLVHFRITLFMQLFI